MNNEELKIVTHWKGDGYVAFYRDLSIVEAVSKPSESFFLSEWITTAPDEVITPTNEWCAMIDLMRSLAHRIIIEPGDYFTCTSGFDTIWILVYATPKSIESFNIKDSVPRFKLYEDSDNLAILCTLKPEIIDEYNDDRTTNKYES